MPRVNAFQSTNFLRSWRFGSRSFWLILKLAQLLRASRADTRGTLFSVDRRKWLKGLASKQKIERPMSRPLITVIMPLKYYHPEFLKKSVQSITRQSCPDWKLTVVVEPTDLAKFRELFERDFAVPRIHVIANQGFRFPGAINTGMKHAGTDFVAILLADDMWANNAIETLNRYIIEYPEIDFVHSSRIVIDETDATISPVYYSKERFSLQDFPWGSPVKHLLCWRREKGLSVGGIDESILKAQDDYDFPWTMAENGATFKAVRDCLYYYRNHLECERLTTHRPLSVTKRGIR